jgi:hypothetical protein
MQCCGTGTEAQEPELFTLAELEPECIPDPFPDPDLDPIRQKYGMTLVKKVNTSKNLKFSEQQCCLTCFSCGFY